MKTAGKFGIKIVFSICSIIMLMSTTNLHAADVSEIEDPAGHVLRNYCHFMVLHKTEFETCGPGDIYFNNPLFEGPVWSAVKNIDSNDAARVVWHFKKDILMCGI